MKFKIESGVGKQIKLYAKNEMYEKAAELELNCNPNFTIVPQGGVFILAQG